MTTAFPHDAIHHDHHGAVLPPRAARREQQEGAEAPRETPADPQEEVRQQVIEEMQEQVALERFQNERPDLWLQTQRITKIMDIQSHCDDQTFPEGACFMHTTAPNYSSFCVKQLMEVDLDTCQLTLEIYDDSELQEGIILLPLECISWFGFPKQAIPTHMDFQGFRNLAAAHEAAAVKAKKAPKIKTARLEKDKE